MVLTYGSVIQLPEQVQPLKVARLSASIPAARGANGGKSTPRIHFPESGYRRCSGKTLQPGLADLRLCAGQSDNRSA